MGDCCKTSENAHPRKRRCPANGLEYPEVSAGTIALHIKDPWLWDGKGMRHYYCDDPACDVVYFGEDDTVILKSQLRTEVKSAAAPLCYCFGVGMDDALENPQIRDYVVSQTRQGLCACDARNPYGRCCLKDFPRK